MSANSPSCSAAPGMPSEEEIARAMRPAVWARCDAAGVTCESTGSGITLGDLTARATSLLDANTVLSLIRPAFEAHTRECQAICDSYAEENQRLHDRALSAEAKIAQAVEALEPFGKVADAFKPAMPDDERRWPGHIPLPTVGDLRRARFAVSAWRGA